MSSLLHDENFNARNHFPHIPSPAAYFACEGEANRFRLAREGSVICPALQR